ncbi:MAG TPA: EpsI family protein [Burkholderiales bacterium]
MMPRWLSLRHVLVGVAMFAATGLAAALKPAGVPPDPTFNLERLIPQSFGDWHLDASIVPVPPSPDVQANLDKLYNQLVSRTYVNSHGERMMLSIAYGGDQSDSLKAHRQEVCYSAQGFVIRELLQGEVDVANHHIPVARLLAVKGQRSEPVTYWFTMGDHVVMSRLGRLLMQLRYGLQGEIPDGMLVRVSNLSGDSRASYQAHAGFLGALLAALDPRTLARVAGQS